MVKNKFIGRQHRIIPEDGIPRLIDHGRPCFRIEDKRVHSRLGIFQRFRIKPPRCGINGVERHYRKEQVILQRLNSLACTQPCPSETYFGEILCLRGFSGMGGCLRLILRDTNFPVLFKRQRTAHIEREFLLGRERENKECDQCQ